MNNSIELQHLTVVTVNPPIASFKAMFGPDDISQSGGVGGWKEVPRPKRQSMTDYEGTPLFTVKIPLMFDGYAHELSVEADLRVLTHMAMKDPDKGHPPIVTFFGAAPGAGRLWVINDIARGTYDRRSSDGALIRQVVTVTFLEYVPPVATIWAVSGPANDAQARHDAEAAAAAAAASRQAAQDSNNLNPAANPAIDQGTNKGDGSSVPQNVVDLLNFLGIKVPGVTDVPGKIANGGVGGLGGVAGKPGGLLSAVGTASTTTGTGSYTVKSGDTLSAIAGSQLGNPNRWQEIADLNGINDPLALRIGQVLRMPS